MQYTVRVLIDPKGNEVKLDAICRIFSSMVRMAYNRLLEGKRPNEVVRLLQNR
jgi:predicted transposase